MKGGPALLNGGQIQNFDCVLETDLCYQIKSYSLLFLSLPSQPLSFAVRNLGMMTHHGIKNKPQYKGQLQRHVSSGMSAIYI